MSDDTYQGSANKETFDVSLWLNNDQGFYEDVTQLAAEARESATEYDDDGEPNSVDADEALYSLRDAIESYWGDVTDPDGKDSEWFIREILPMITDIGSLFRVDWTEIAKEFLAE